MLSLENKVGLVVGVANDHSIAWGCAQQFAKLGAKLVVTYQSDKAKPHVEPLAQALNADLLMPLDVQREEQVDALFDAIRSKFGRLDFVLHSIAFVPKQDLHGRVVDVSLEGFLKAMDISCHSFLRLARRAEPLMKDGGCLLTVTYYGSEKVVSHYNIMGPVKAALEASVRYMAKELGPKRIRVNALSPGPMSTRAASGIQSFDTLLEQAKAKSPMGQIVTLEDVGHMAAFLVSDVARNITANICYVDAGYQVVD
jgi:enoyl-[acyl-carrier protein] reductase I